MDGYVSTGLMAVRQFVRPLALTFDRAVEQKESVAHIQYGSWNVTSVNMTAVDVLAYA